MCYAPVMADSVSVRELRNTISAVLRRVEAGERLTVTVDRRPVAEIGPLRPHRTVQADVARKIALQHATDPGMPAELRRLLPDSTDDA
jgi:prevent-host-death family protein